MHTTSADRWLSLPQPFGTSEAGAHGIAGTTVRAAAARGDLTEVWTGLYAESRAWAAADRATRHRGLAMAAWRLTPDVSISHWSGGVVLGGPTPRYLPREAAVTALSTSSTNPRPDWRIHHHGQTRPDHIRLLPGSDARVTTWPRTVVDAARHLNPQDALAIADHALRTGATTHRALAVVRTEQRRWPGVLKAETVLALADGRRESWLESASAWVIHAFGWPCPVPQVWLYTGQGRFLGRPDQLWPLLGMAGESDGLGKYSAGATGVDEAGLRMHVARELKAERERERGFESNGLVVARWGASDLANGGHRLDRELASTQRRARPDAIDLLWRMDPGDPLRPWADLVRCASDLALHRG